MSYTVCSPEFATILLGLNPADGLEEESRIRGRLVKGRLHNVAVELIAEQGVSVVINTVLFVPDNAAGIGPDLTGLSFLGMYMCLDTRIFALDALSQMFYFN